MTAFRKRGRFCSVSALKSKCNLVPIQSEVDASGDCKINQSSWRNGRRIIELGYFADQMICENCNSSLHLADIINETKYGLASFFDVKCRQCSFATAVTSGKRHKVTEDGACRCFDINTKMAAAMLNAGVGETQSSIYRSLVQREREIGSTIEKVAQQSCSDVLTEEKAILTENDTTEAKVVLDGGWQKRGSGRTNNSMSGHLMVIGTKTKRCIEFGVAKKSCRICKSTKKKSITRKHDCRKNFSGSSKAMESFLAVKTLQKIEQNRLKVGKVVMDDDSTTYSRLKSSVNNQIIKCSDNNHVTKNFTNELYKIQENHKCLSRKHISYLQKCFNYAVAQNKGSQEGVRANLQSIIPHVYGTHELCEDKPWCTYHNDPTAYRHKSLPHGKDFKDVELKERLAQLFSKYLTSEMLHKLATLDSSNCIENMNQLVARKAPKALHYSESESLDYRVSAAVLQKNEGHMYMCKVNENHKMSPGKYTLDRFIGLDEKRERRRMTQETGTYKKRRLQLKEEKRQGQEFSENLEGTTYGMDPFTPLEPEALVDVPEPVLNPGPPSIGTEATIVVFDLETTGFDMNSDIIQIAAMEMSSKGVFSRYVYPASGVIPDKIARLTGIMYCSRQLSHYGKLVDGSSVKEACEAFLSYIQQFAPVVLVAHNVLFDSKLLLNCFQKCNLKYSTIIHGFGDTLKLFRKEFPDRRTNGLSFKQVDLVRDLLNKGYTAHSAQEDVAALTELVDIVPMFARKLPLYRTGEIENRITRINNSKLHMSSYKTVIDRGVLPVAKSKSLASAGIPLPYLQIIYKRSGVDRLMVILKRILSSPQKSQLLCVIFLKLPKCLKSTSHVTYVCSHEQTVTYQQNINVDIKTYIIKRCMTLENVILFV